METSYSYQSKVLHVANLAVLKGPMRGNALISLVYERPTRSIADPSFAAVAGTSNKPSRDDQRAPRRLEWYPTAICLCSHHHSRRLMSCCYRETILEKSIRRISKEEQRAILPSKLAHTSNQSTSRTLSGCQTWNSRALPVYRVPCSKSAACLPLPVLALRAIMSRACNTAATTAAARPATPTYYSKTHLACL